MINEKEATIVRRIFELYVSGTGCTAITGIFVKEGIRTFTGREKWDFTSIIKILKNEKYQGDVLCQKTYIENHLSKKTVINHGELNQYYIQDNHPAIVPREIWDKAQQIMAERKYNRKSKTNDPNFNYKYPYKGLLFCGKCGAMLLRKVWGGKASKRYVWQCSNHVNKRKRTCSGTNIEEKELAKISIQGETIIKVVKKDGKKHYSYSSKNE